jgi:hypothetical protein
MNYDGDGLTIAGLAIELIGLGAGALAACLFPPGPASTPTQLNARISSRRAGIWWQLGRRAAGPMVVCGAGRGDGAAVSFRPRSEDCE